MGIGTLLIRADASPEIGAGHVMRCIALAQAWRRSKGNAIFVSASSLPLAVDRILKEGFRLELLKDEPGSRWDASSTKAIAESSQARWMAIDGYHFGASYLGALQTSGSKILLIDDEGRRDCAVVDVVLNQNLHAAADMYPTGSGTLLLGTRFVMLREEFIEGRPEKERQNPKIATNILVTFGGGKQREALNEMLTAVGALGGDAEVVVVGQESPQVRQLDLGGHIRVLGTVDDLSSIMAWSDIAVSAAGSTCWELCRLGVPSILIDFADNQRALGRELAVRGIAAHIPREKADAASIAQNLKELAGDQRRRWEMSEKGMRLIDGRGAQRVVAALRAHEISLRDATVEDARLLWNWRNDPVVRSASFSGELVSWDDHCTWMARKLGDGESRLWIAEECRCPLGTIQAQRTSEGGAQLGITIAPEFRGQGLAASVIRMAAEQAMQRWGPLELYAFIKPQNVPSIRAFEEAGFEFRSITTVNSCEAARYFRAHRRLGNRNDAAYGAVETRV